MSEILKNAKKHFHHRNADLRKISVPEWECEIYYKPASNLSIQERLVELTQENKFEKIAFQIETQFSFTNKLKQFTATGRSVVVTGRTGARTPCFLSAAILGSGREAGTHGLPTKKEPRMC